MDDHFQGATLVAAPHLADPNFFRSVVLVASHDDDGALGLILNRPTDIPVDDVLTEWADLIAPPAVAFSGGPVQTEVAVGVARLKAGVAPPVADAWSTIGERVGLLDLSIDASLVRDGVEAARVFAGYAGWAPGQLEAEVESGDWFVVPFHPDDPFRADAVDLWRQVLRRQPGRLRMFADFPIDPRTN